MEIYFSRPDDVRPDVNFTNILRADFMPIFWCQNSSNLKCKCKKAVCANLHTKKSGHKILVKLTTAHILNCCGFDYSFSSLRKRGVLKDNITSLLSTEKDIFGKIHFFILILNTRGKLRVKNYLTVC
jgi:hypothetical protein